MGMGQSIHHEHGGTTLLVLSRKRQESVVVGGSGTLEQLLKVTILEIKSDRVRLGFDADTAIAIHRWEVWERIHAGGQSDCVGEDRAEPMPGGCLPSAPEIGTGVRRFITSSCCQRNRSGKAIPGR
jgi:carbon storage regulator